MLRTWLGPLAALALAATPLAACGPRATPEQCAQMCAHSIKVNGYAGVDTGIGGAGLEGQALEDARTEARKQVDDALVQAAAGEGALGESFKSCVASCNEHAPSKEIVDCILAATTGDAINACVK